ncbi:MAG: TPM domain-containing protein [Desulfuromonadales bacterium]
MKTASKFFTDEEKARIEAAVRAAEMRTSGEIVPMVVNASFDYPRAELIGAGFFAMGGAALLTWAFGHDSQWVFIPLFLLLFLPCKGLLAFFPALKRRLIPEAEIIAEVEERALVAFVENGVHHTRDATGILILISLMEHRVHVLADRGINAAVPPHTWDEIVHMVTAGIHSGQTADALCAAIARCGDLLAEQFPRKKDDTDELPNLIVE